MKVSINIVFFGTPDIGLKSLEYLYNSPNFNVMAVVTQPDKPSGRGQKLTPSPIKVFALENNIQVFQPKSIRKEPEVIEALKALSPLLLQTKVISLTRNYQVEKSLLK